jgi:glutamate synthase (NADPH/NADH) small chain
MPKTGAQLTPKQLQTNFADIHPTLSPDEAEAAAARCLFCYDAPCTRACPTHIDIPRFIRQIMHKDAQGSAKTILDANIFGGSCARICPTEVLCEGACVENTLHSAPVLIGRLQRHACDKAHDASMDFYAPGAPTGQRVAIVGAGPSGLTCAHELRKRGHDVDVFEAGKVPGGLNTLGIAAYKITTDFALSEVERIKRLGMNIHLKSPIDGARLAELLEEYDAVYLAIGLGRTAPLGIPGEDHKDVWESLAFIEQTHSKPLAKCAVGRDVVVIGGGNTAIDCANAAVRLGAETVTMAYRRGREAMPAFAHEVELAVESQVEFEWNTAPTKVMTRGGKVTGLRCYRTRAAPARGGVAAAPRGGRSARTAKLVKVRNSEFTIPCDMVIKALGQEPLADLVSAMPMLKITGKYRVAVDSETFATSVPKLFAGGDCRSNAFEEVVNAVQDGKRAAAGIHQALLD